MTGSVEKTVFGGCHGEYGIQMKLTSQSSLFSLSFMGRHRTITFTASELMAAVIQWRVFRCCVSSAELSRPAQLV